MKLLDRRRAVVEATGRLQRERRRWQTETHTLRKLLARHRTLLILGGGGASGFIAGLLPWSAFARAGGIVSAAISFALRSPIGAMLADDLRQRASDEPPPPPPA
ncbi:MAG TPA: hypothetical protein VGC55_09055 [Dokdonella sp.]